MKVTYSDLKNKRVFISGGGSGIGATIVDPIPDPPPEIKTLLFFKSKYFTFIIKFYLLNWHQTTKLELNQNIILYLYLALF